MKNRIPAFCVILTAAFVALMCGKSPSPAKAGQVREVRPPAGAGSYYPADSAELSGMVAKMLTHSRLSHPVVKPVGLISPHAAIFISGPVAAAGFKQLKGCSYSTVVVVAPSHREYFEFCSVYNGPYRTPLGTVEVDSPFVSRLVEAGGSVMRSSTQGHRQEHLGMGEYSLEVQLPFLQHMLGDFKLVPVVMGVQSDRNCRVLADAIVETVGGRDDVLLIASSDLSHFHGYDEANRIDGRFISYVRGLDYKGLSAAIAGREVEACGGGPVIAVMMACEKLGARGVRILSSANSGDITGDRNRVVGYLSAMFYKSEDLEKGAEKSPGREGQEMGLTDREKKYLLKVARESIRYAVAGGDDPPEHEAITPTMGENRGAFVTIKKKGQLRGCIGYIVAVKPLVETVYDMARSAALNDHRFSPVTEGELDGLKLEISALTPIRDVKDINSIDVGRDGLIVKRGRFQGLLLPQVATEYGWDRETFLAQTCRKAGLPPDAWKMKDTQIQSFRAEVFGEEDFR
ncbi:MAG: AmmeMemoRadiSam system protein B [Gemmatimonadota bacterium]|nr:AmmeMemoRadiSam system protein B [Gemmatimonadota bacterium]